MICFILFDFEGLCVHHFIVMFWLKASVSMNMLYMVVTAPVSKPWMFWLKAAALLNMSSMVIMAPVSTSLTFWLKTFASQNMQDVIVMAPVWETDARRLGEE